MNGSYARDGENRSDNGRSSNDMSLASNNRSGICLKLSPADDANDERRSSSRELGTRLGRDGSITANSQASWA